MDTDGIQSDMKIRSCKNAWQHMTEICKGRAVRNYTQLLDMQDYLVETELFSAPVLDAYSSWNLEKEISADQKRHFSDLRGGGQGDYRKGMRTKIANVIDCLTHFPQSKRAVITTCNEPMPKHSNDDHAKCLREIYFHLDADNKLNTTVTFRAQAAVLFPKNIHFIGSMMSEIAERLPQSPSLGVTFYLAIVLVSDRE